MDKKNILLYNTVAFCAALCAAFCAVLPVHAETAGEPMAIRVSDILTMPLAFVGETFGFPSGVATVRGPEKEMDDVVFMYPNGLELYIAHDLVWQVHLTCPESGTVHGITAGMDREAAERALPAPYSVYGDSSVFRLPGAAYPIGLHLYWDQAGQTVTDVYLFRADY
ncbi:MAG: hypothetical protein LBR47_02930 [Spirochaetaceae bacterium]|jgi:hypothetical protein|nr:hypothetical protein [Spirochaetaceae bacterium]